VKRVKKPFNIKTQELGTLMFWAYTPRQAIVLAKKFINREFTVKGTEVNYHAMNMYQKPQNYGEFLAYGGGQ